MNTTIPEKARLLKLLQSKGFQVPPFIYMPPDDFKHHKFEKLEKFLARHCDGYKVIARSAHAQEHQFKSGTFDSFGTYADVGALCDAIGEPGVRYAIGFPSYRNWWDRWFGFLTLYYAASGGAPYLDLENNEVLFNNEAGMAVLNFMDAAFRLNCAPTEDLTDPMQNDLVAGWVMGP